MPPDKSLLSPALLDEDRWDVDHPQCGSGSVRAILAEPRRCCKVLSTIGAILFSGRVASCPKMQNSYMSNPANS